MPRNLHGIEQIFHDGTENWPVRWMSWTSPRITRYYNTAPQTAGLKIQYDRTLARCPAVIALVGA
jgi:hypothetical protein